MKTIKSSERENYKKHEWTRIVNGLSGFKSVNLVGTVNDKGEENLSVISSFFHLGAAPPLMGFVLRPHSKESPRHTLINLKETGFYTLNAVSEDFFIKAHQASGRYPKDVSEFDEVGLESVYKDEFKAPYVKKSPIQIGFKLVEVIDVKHNKTHIVIGEITELHILKEMIREDGFLDLEAGKILALSGLDSYHKTERLERLSYAKPDKKVSFLDLDGNLK